MLHNTCRWASHETACASQRLLMTCLKMVPTGINAPSEHYTFTCCWTGRCWLYQRLFATFESIMLIVLVLFVGALLIIVIGIARSSIDWADHMVGRMVLLVDKVLRKLMPRWPVVIWLDHSHFGLGMLGRVAAELVVMVADDAVLASAVLLLLEVVVVLGLRRRWVLTAAISRCRRFDNLSLSGMIVAVAGCLVLFAVISVTATAEDVLGFALKVEIVVLDHGLVVLLQVNDGRAGWDARIINQFRATAGPALRLCLRLIDVGWVMVYAASISVNLKFVWTFLFLLSFYGGTLSAHGILSKLLVLLWNYHFISALLLMKVCVFYSFLLQDFFSLHILRVLFKFSRRCGSSNNIFLFEVIIVIIVNMSISFESTRLANIRYPVANWFCLSLMRPIGSTPV